MAMRARALLLAIGLSGALPVFAADTCARYPIHAKGGVHYIDRAGKVAIATLFDAAGDFADGLAPAAAGERWGYIDCAGKWVIEPRFTSAQECRDGYCRVTRGRNFRFELVDRRGRFVPMPALDGVYLPHDGRVVGWKGEGDRSRGVADLDGRIVVPPALHVDGESEYSEGLLAACTDANRCGYIDRDGHWVVAPTWWRTGAYADGFARVMPDRETVAYLRRDGTRAFARTFRSGWDFRDGRAPASEDGKLWGMIDASGAFVLAPSLEFIGEHRDGRVLYMRGGHWGVLDYAGRVVVDALYDQATLLAGGVTRVSLADETGYFDRDGHAFAPIGTIREWGTIRRISLIRPERLDCGESRLDLHDDGHARWIVACADRTFAGTAPGTYDSDQGRRAFVAVAEFAADAGLLRYDASAARHGVDIVYDRVEIETADGLESLDVADGVSPRLRALDASLKQAARDIEWRGGGNRD